MIVRCFTFFVAVIMLSTSSDPSSFGQAVTSLHDIDFWVGSGTQEAALAIDWDGQSNSDAAYIWGYRWEGVANGGDMLIDVISADARLYAKLGALAGLGTATVGLGYDQNDDRQFQLSDHTTFDPRGISNSGLSDGETSSDPADYYAEGWFLGFWHVGFAAANPFDQGAFSSSLVGVDGLMLTDDSWLSLAFSTDTFSTSNFAENLVAAAVATSADFDSDDDIDGADFLTWQRGFGLWDDASFQQGDANGDQRVDQLDLQLWSTAFGSSATLSDAHLSNANPSSTRTIPEPSTIAHGLALAVAAAIGTLLDLNRLPRKCSS